MGESENEGSVEPARSAPAFQAVNRRSMAGDSDTPTRSSNLSSREVSRAPHADNGHVGLNGNGRATSKSAVSRLASPNLSSTGRTPVPEDSARSGTATRHASTSSQMSSNQPVVPTYGTRSRRQPRGSRPNYTEDMEMDFEAQQIQHNAIIQSRAESPLSELEAEPDVDLAETTVEQLKAAELRRKQDERNAKRKAARAAEKAEKTNGQASVNGDSTPVAESSSMSANNSLSLPRKRKAATVATQNITINSQPAPPVLATNVKKPTSTAIKAPTERETNMVTFEKCNARLNKSGVLVADDGETFAPNGEPSQRCYYYVGHKIL